MQKNTPIYVVCSAISFQVPTTSIYVNHAASIIAVTGCTTMQYFSNKESHYIARTY